MAKMKKKISKSAKVTIKRHLTIKLRHGTIPGVREAIINQQKRLGWSTYKVAKAVSGKMTPQAVYDYLTGRSDMLSENIAALLAALGLEIRPRE